MQSILCLTPLPVIATYYIITSTTTHAWSNHVVGLGQTRRTASGKFPPHFVSANKIISPSIATSLKISSTDPDENATRTPQTAEKTPRILAADAGEESVSRKVTETYVLEWDEDDVKRMLSRKNIDAYTSTNEDNETGNSKNYFHNNGKRALFNGKIFALSNCWGRRPFLLRRAFDPDTLIGENSSKEEGFDDGDVLERDGYWPSWEEVVDISSDEEAEAR